MPVIGSLKNLRRFQCGETHLRLALGSNFRYLRWDLSSIDNQLMIGKSLSSKWGKRLETIRCLYEQQKHMNDNHTHKVENRRDEKTAWYAATH